MQIGLKFKKRMVLQKIPIDIIEHYINQKIGNFERTTEKQVSQRKEKISLYKR